MQQIRALLLIVVLLCLAAPAAAFADAPTDAPAAAPSAGPTTPEEMEAFVAPLIERQLEEHHIPGATFVFVKDGEVFYKGGFGLANLERGEAVEVDRHLFDIASVTKLYTTTAVMQLVAEGKLDLHADVNDYLTEFEVPATYPEPITLAHLLTHTAGFDEFTEGMLVARGVERPALGTYLANHLPPRIRPPGTTYQYSNHGMALAGHLVEVASGVAFTDYVERRILAPMGLERTTFDRPERLADDFAVGYGYARGEQKALDAYDLSVVPAGGLKATAPDVAQFMIMHLQLGRHGEARVLPENMARIMQARQFGVDSRVAGTAYGFYERKHNRLRMIEHAGDAPDGFSSVALLIPEHDTGFFVAYNGTGGGLARYELLEALLDRYYPVGDLERIEPPADFDTRAGSYEGTFRLNRYNRTGIMRMVGLVMPMNATVSVNDDRTITLEYPLNLMKPARFVEVEPDLFRQVDRDLYLAYRGEGDSRELILGAPLNMVLEGSGLLESSAFNLGLLAIVQLTMLASLLGWPLGWAWRRLRKRPKSSKERRRLIGLAYGYTVLVYVFFGVYAAVLSAIAFGTHEGLLPLVTALSWVLALFVAPLLYAARGVWRSQEWSLPGQLFYTWFALVSLVFTAAMVHWHLLPGLA